jgi:hypothetical protein
MKKRFANFANSLFANQHLPKAVSDCGIVVRWWKHQMRLPAGARPDS